MKTLFLATTISVFAIILAACGGGGADWGGPKDLIQKQVKWTNNGEWDKLLQTCKPSLRANHTVASLKSEMESLATLGVSKIGVKDISVREEGDVAYASYG